MTDNDKDIISKIANHISNAVKEQVNTDNSIRKIVLNGPIEIMTHEPVTIYKSTTSIIENKNIDFDKFKEIIHNSIANDIVNKHCVQKLKESNISDDVIKSISDCIKKAVSATLFNNESVCECKNEKKRDELLAFELAGELMTSCPEWSQGKCLHAADELLKKYRVINK